MWRGKRARAREQQQAPAATVRSTPPEPWFHQGLHDDVVWIARRIDPQVTDEQIERAFDYVLTCPPFAGLVNDVHTGLGMHRAERRRA